MPTDNTRNERQRRWREKRRGESKQSYTVWLENETVDCLKRLMEKYEHKADQMISTALKELEAQDKRKEQEAREQKEQEAREEKQRMEKMELERKKQAEKTPPQKLDEKAKNKLISEIQEMRQSGMNFTQIASRLKENKTPTQSGKGEWNRKMVSRLLAKL